MFLTIGESSVAKHVSLFALPTRKHMAKIFFFFHSFAYGLSSVTGIGVGFFLPLWFLLLIHLVIFGR